MSKCVLKKDPGLPSQIWDVYYPPSTLGTTLLWSATVGEAQTGCRPSSLLKQTISHDQFDETDWWSLQRTLTSLPRLFQLWAAKHVNRIAGTMSFLSHQDGRCDRCLSCETCVETCPHIARCPEAGRASAFAQSTDKLELWLGTNKTHPDLRSLFLSYTRRRGTVTCLECAISLDLPPILHNLARSQDVIGWDLYLFIGGYPKYWVKMASGELSNFDAFYLTNPLV